MYGQPQAAISDDCMALLQFNAPLATEERTRSRSRYGQPQAATFDDCMALLQFNVPLATEERPRSLLLSSHMYGQPQAANSDDWMALLHFNAPLVTEERPRTRSRWRSSIPRGLRPPAESASEEEGDKGPSDIFIEQSPPKMPDNVQEQCDGLPIFFNHGAACVSDTLRTAVNRYTGGGAFYIGATLNPRMRWLGRSSADERGDMPGHLLRWEAMIIIAYTAEGPRIETSAIEFAKTLWQDRCTNVKPDARGQVRGLDNFIYVCV